MAGVRGPRAGKRVPVRGSGMRASPSRPPATSVSAVSADEPVRGRRRESSRHRTSRSAGLPGWFAWMLRSGTPLVSLLPALVAVVLVQSLSPAAQRLPTGAARFALGGGWAATSAGGIHGYGHWFTTPMIGWLQLGALDRLLLGGRAQTVLAAAHGVMLLTTLAGVALLWFVLRRAGASGLAAGVSSAAFGIAPIAIAVHTEVVPGERRPRVAAGRGAARARRAAAPGASVAIGATAAAAVLTAPIALVALPSLVWAFLLPQDRRERTLLRAVGAPPVQPSRRPAIGALAGFLVVLAVGLLVAPLLAGSGGAAGSADAIGAAAAGQAAFPAAGAASAVAWLRTDPLSLLLGLVAVVLTARSRRMAPRHLLGRPGRGRRVLAGRPGPGRTDRAAAAGLHPGGRRRDRPRRRRARGPAVLRQRDRIRDG